MRNFSNRMGMLATQRILDASPPAVLPGTACGVLTYKRISDVNFKRISYCLLGLSGAVLLLKVLLA